jgi:hypothetical protein
VRSSGLEKGPRARGLGPARCFYFMLIDSRISAALCSARNRLATADNEALFTWLPPPHPRFPLRSVCLADSSLPRAMKRLAGRGCLPRTPAFRCARPLSCRRSLPRATKRWVGRGCLPPPRPRFPLRSAFVLQAARCRGQRSTWQVGAVAHEPRFPLRSGCLAGSSLPRVTKTPLCQGLCLRRSPLALC